EIGNRLEHVLAAPHPGQPVMDQGHARRPGLLVHRCFLKYSIVRPRPSSRSTLGDQPKSCFARVISGQRRVGSSSRAGRLVIFDFEPVSRITASANSRIVRSLGFPQFTGSCSLLSKSLTMPSTRSLT